jgi:Flp pilus assembly protein TadD
VPFKAVALNMRGFVHMQNQRYQEAADAYQGALQVFPDYQLAQNNLRFLVAQLEAASE